MPAGTVVWLASGRYETGNLALGEGIRGTRAEPVIYRSEPGGRATIAGQIQVKNDHIWLWGLEIAGPPESGVSVLGGDGIKVINCVIHDKGAAQLPVERKPSGQGIGGWDVGNDHEFYGNILYHNGWTTLDHGIYSQNQAKHTVKRYVDNIVFENAGFGLHLYGSDPYLDGLYVEGNCCFATGLMPRHPNPPQVNILIGGMNRLANVIVRGNCTYHPSATSKRGVDIGYSGSPNRDILIENNYFTGGSHAMELKGVSDAVVRSNQFWAPRGTIVMQTVARPGPKPIPASELPKLGDELDVLGKISMEEEPAETERPSKPVVIWEHNTYLDNGAFDLAAWRERSGSGATDRFGSGTAGRPADVFVFTRINRYEPDRVHLAIFNWPRTDAVAIPLDDVLQNGQSFRLMDPRDLWGKPVAAGTYSGSAIRVSLTGPYAPEFACYILFRKPIPGGAD